MSVYHMNCASDCLRFQEAAFGKQKSDSQADSQGGTCYFFKTMFMKSGGEHPSANNF